MRDRRDIPFDPLGLGPIRSIIVLLGFGAALYFTWGIRDPDFDPPRDDEWRATLQSPAPRSTNSRLEEAVARCDGCDACDEEIIAKLRALPVAARVSLHLPYSESPDPDLERLKAAMNTYGELGGARVTIDRDIEPRVRPEGVTPSREQDAVGWPGALQLSIATEEQTFPPTEEPYVLARSRAELPYIRRRLARYLLGRRDAAGSAYRTGWAKDLGGDAIDPKVVIALQGSPNTPTLTASFGLLPLNGGEIDRAAYAVLLVARPAHLISEAEVRAIDGFLMRGSGSVMIVTSNSYIDGGEPRAVTNSNLDRWLELMGFELGSEVLTYTPRSYCAEGVGGSSKELCFPAIPLVDVSIDRGSAMYGGPLGLTLPAPYASPVVVRREVQPDVRYSVLSSIPTSDPAGAARPVVVYAEGAFKSAFAERWAEGRILVVSSSYFLGNAVTATKPDAYAAQAEYQDVYLSRAATFIAESSRSLNYKFDTACDPSNIVDSPSGPKPNSSTPVPSSGVRSAVDTSDPR